MKEKIFKKLRQVDPQKTRKVIKISTFIAVLLLFFLGGLLLGSYLEKRKVAPIKINLGGLEQSVIQAPELRSKIKWGKEIFIYDLRTKEEYDKGHIRNATSMPVAELTQRYSEIPKEKEVVIYCQNYSCGEAGQAVIILDAAGYKNFRVLFGGVEEWVGQDNKLVK